MLWLRIDVGDDVLCCRCHQHVDCDWAYLHNIICRPPIVWIGGLSCTYGTYVRNFRITILLMYVVARILLGMYCKPPCTNELSPKPSNFLRSVHLENQILAIYKQCIRIYSLEKLLLNRVLMCAQILTKIARATKKSRHRRTHAGSCCYYLGI